MIFWCGCGQKILTAAHAVSTVQALVTGAVSDRRVTATITRRSVSHHFGQLTLGPVPGALGIFNLKFQLRFNSRHRSRSDLLGRLLRISSLGGPFLCSEVH